MAASATPTIYDPKVLARGSLGTTLTTTLYTCPAEAGVRVLGIILCCTGTTPRLITLDTGPSGSPKKIVAAAYIAHTDGLGRDALDAIGLKQGVTLDGSDLIRGGQDVGTDVDYLIVGTEMKD